MENSYFKNYEEEYNTLEAMERMGGSFVKLLPELYRRADGFNKRKLTDTFKEYFDDYKQKAEEYKNKK